MRAARIDSAGADPWYGDLPTPGAAPGDVLIETVAASLNPIDLAVAAGTFFGGHPEYPYSPGIEAVGRVHGTGELVFAMGGGVGVSRSGTSSQLFTASADSLIPVPNGVPPALAAALGTAGLAGWMSLAWRARVTKGETVLVLGATGAVGRVAVQAARILGARRVIGVGRDQERLADVARHADAVLTLEDGAVPAQAAAECDGGVDVILDALWGRPLETVLSVARPGARIVHVGASAGPAANLPSAAVRGRQLELLGYSNFAVPKAELREGYLALLSHAREGMITLDIAEYPLQECAAAWSVLRSGTRKVVLLPETR